MDKEEQSEPGIDGNRRRPTDFRRLPAVRIRGLCQSERRQTDVKLLREGARIVSD